MKLYLQILLFQPSVKNKGGQEECIVGNNWFASESGKNNGCSLQQNVIKTIL